MKNARMTICLMATILVMATGQGFGVTEYKDGATHNISSTINDDVWVDYLAPGMQTTVNMLDGGLIDSPYQLQGYNNSRINISGGSVSDYLVAHDSSQVTISGGSGGSALVAYDSSQVTISGGSAGILHAYDRSQVTMSGGQAYYLWAFNSSQVTISGGRVSDALIAYGSSQVTISSGRVGGGLIAYDSSQVTISGGSVGDSSDGVDYLVATGNSQVTISGGSFDDGFLLVAYLNSQITINGSNFAIDGTPFSSGEITSILGGDWWNEPYRTITGTLANGDIINNQFQIGNQAKIVLIPEPTALLLLALGGLLIRKQ